MSFGLTFTNNSDVVTLDSEFSRLVVLQSGRFAPGGGSFNPVITTVEPPMLFLRPDANLRIQYFTILGSPGNWTGWSYIRDVAGTNVAGSYFAAAFKSRAVDKFGLRLWNASSDIIFDSGTAAAQITSVITSYLYAGSEGTGQAGQFRSSFIQTAPLAAGDYMMVNNLGMDVAGYSTRYAKLAGVIDYTNNRIVMEITGVNNVTTGFFIPSLFAKTIQ